VWLKNEIVRDKVGQSKGAKLQIEAGTPWHALSTRYPPTRFQELPVKMLLLRISSRVYCNLSHDHDPNADIHARCQYPAPV